MKIIELSLKDKDYIQQVVEMEKETFGKFGGVDLWILKPMVNYGKVFVLIKENRVIGAAEFMVAFDRLEGFLYGFSVMKEYRKEGAGTLLLEYAEKYLKKEKIKTISLTVDPKNIKAIELYKKRGYSIESLGKDEYDIGIDRYLMKKIL